MMFIERLKSHLLLKMHMGSLSKLYEYHHEKTRKTEFSILEKERGALFSAWIGKDKKIMDIGCRDGTLTRYFTKGNDVLGIDIDTKMLETAKKKLGIKTKLMDLNDDWDVKEKFDAIVAAEVVEHLYYPDLICKKVSEHLKPGGLFIGSVPNAYNIKNRIRYLFGIQKNTPLEDRTHINQFSHKILKNVLEQHFSKVELIGLASGLSGSIARLFPNLGSFILTWRCEK
jgi:2-polyprenyl-3-methyl-5-hydroxy-6-metoxy-1,4-benzoquinol methylase